MTLSPQELKLLEERNIRVIEKDDALSIEYDIVRGDAVLKTVKDAFFLGKSATYDTILNKVNLHKTNPRYARKRK